MRPGALGFRAIRGGSVVVGVDGYGPRVVLSTFLATAAKEDRLSLEPYHVAAEMGLNRHAEASAAIAEGRRRQDERAARNLDEIVRELRNAGYRPATAALLVNRAGWITDLLQYSLAAPEHPAVAEGLAVRDALRFALGRANIAIEEMDEKSLQEVASARLHLSPVDLEIRLKGFGATVGKPWRKEQKLACLAAWLAAAAF